MGKKNRVRKRTVYISYEGDREGFFLKFLERIYKPNENSISLMAKNSNGGSPDRVVKFALDECHREASVAWFDEDFEPTATLTEEIREKLAAHWIISTDRLEDFMACPMAKLNSLFNPNNRKPVLIVSTPVCVESIILRALGMDCPVAEYDHAQRDTQIASLKNCLGGLIGKDVEDEFYENNITKGMLEKTRENCPELNAILSLFEK